MKYISLFSGIEAASVAWEGLGWEPVCFAELDEFPSAVLAYRYPEVPNVGDVTKVNWRRYKGKCDVVVGGSPCQSFSVAGKREGLRGESGLMYEYIRAVRDIRPAWFLWENVPGALSSEGGKAFRQLLSEMDELGYGMAWRVLDAQFFGVAQRRRRVFLVGHIGACHPAEVLFEPESLRGDYPSSREKRAELAARARRRAEVAAFRYGAGSGAGGVGFGRETSPTLTAAGSGTNRAPAVVSFAQNSRDEVRVVGDGTVCGALAASPGAKQTTYVVQKAASTQYGEEVAGTLTARFDSSPCPDRGANVVCVADDTARAAVDFGMCGSPPAIAVDGDVARGARLGKNGRGWGIEVAGTLSTSDVPAVCRASGQSARQGEDPPIARAPVVRRLTPLECERLQGFPDGWTRIPWRGRPAEECPDGPRYKAMGNSMAVPVMRWIGEKMDFVEGLEAEVSAE